MTAAALLKSLALWVSVMAPLVAVPLTLITFYLRSMREDQLTRYSELLQRTRMNEATIAELMQRLRDFERNYTTKEEWLRETMRTARTIEQLGRAAIRLRPAELCEGGST